MSIPTSSEQIAWVGDNVIGHSIDPHTKQIDPTEGFGAFDSVFSIPTYINGRAIDIGGGSSDINCAYVAQKHLVDCMVYDPYMRNNLHNKKILKIAEKRPFSTVFSLSVLNVISDKDARRRHILLCLQSLKQGGKAIFKVWPGNGSGIGKNTPSGYQSNCGIDAYLSEITNAFRGGTIILDHKEKTVICINNRVAFPSGSTCL